MLKLFKNYSKMVGNEMAQLIDERPLSSDPQRFYDTGSYTMNALISGDMFKGVPEGKITSLAGDPGTGKTFIALSVVKHIAKRGIAQSQMTTQYFASDDSLASNLTEKGKSLNRRVNIKIFTKNQIPKLLPVFI